MTTIELNKLNNASRKLIKSINGVEFSENYPILETSNRYASYYDVNKQSNVYLKAPFTVELR